MIDNSFVYETPTQKYFDKLQRDIVTLRTQMEEKEHEIELRITVQNVRTATSVVIINRTARSHIVCQLQHVMTSSDTLMKANT